MNKTLKKILIVALIIVIIGLCIGGYFIYRHATSYIGAKAAVAIAVADAGIDQTQIEDADAEFEKNASSAWYDVDIDTHGTEYDYTVDAVTGEILHSSSKAD